MEDQDKAINLFISKTKFKESDVKSCKEIHFGYTNKSFLFTLTNNEKYQVRIGKNNQIIDRSIENEIISKIEDNVFIYMDENGNAIKKWVDGKNPKFIFNKKQLLKSLSTAIIKLHGIDIKTINISKQNYFEYMNKKIIELYPAWTKKYLEVLEKYQNLDLVFSHNDINPLNMIYQKKTKKMVLIDYEWARLNYRYWDLANFFRETNLQIKWLKYLCKYYPNLEYQILLEFCFVCSFYAHLWSYKINQTPKIIKYRKRNLKKVKHFYSLIQQ